MKDLLCGLLCLFLLPFESLIKWLAKPKSEDDLWP